MKRFFKEVSAVPAAGGGFDVCLDGKPMRTPAGTPLRLPHAALAEAVAAEWRAQGEQVLPHTMPVTQLASTALDRVPHQRPAILAHVLSYADTDLLCYRAAGPEDLAARQTALWQPVLDWLSARLGVDLAVTEGILPITQSEAALAALSAHVSGYDDFTLAAFQAAVAALGSLFLAVALAERRLTAEEVVVASLLDETYQIEFWGEDPETMLRRTNLRNDIIAAGRFMDICFHMCPPMHS
ncbi:ATP12 chaperone protein [mine drainage metagenome]|uniref:ATP12 chaperone protein n=1 Tax=mine drainage metagenome TaxID=410659 RepID=A0A1J5SNJ2_9ZZZZ